MKIRVGWSVNLSDFFTYIQLVNFDFLKAKKNNLKRFVFCALSANNETTFMHWKHRFHHIFQRFLLFLYLKDDFLVLAPNLRFIFSRVVISWRRLGSMLVNFNFSDKIFYRPTDRLIFSKWKWREMKIFVIVATFKN